MPTALAATYQAGTASAPPSVLLQVTGAPGKPVSAYASTFAATLDSWTGSGTGFALVRDTARTPIAMKLTGPGNTPSFVTASRVVTGLTVGIQYRLRAYVQTTSGSWARIGVSGIGSSFIAVYTARALVDYTFTATATSHTITLESRAPNTAPSTAWADTITVDPITAWLGTKIVRTDANGVAAVRLDPGQDIPNGSTTMTVTDYEAALTGAVSYTVTDGLGATAVAAPATPAAPGAWLTQPATAVPTTTPPKNVQLDLVVDYDEDSESNGSLHTIIGRSDPIANPGPLTLRKGTLTLYVATWTQADALRDLLVTGEIAMLRQPTYPDLDMYFTVQNLRISPDAARTATQRWAATMQYAEVLAP